MESEIKAGKTLTNNEANLDNDAQTAGAEEDLGANSLENYGKFSNVKSLVDAYNSLQSEFTRRCQKVKELQRELEISRQGKQSYLDLQTDDIEREKRQICEIIPQSKNVIDSLVEIADANGDDKNGRLYRAYAELLIKQKDESDKINNSYDHLIKKIEETPALKEEIIRNYLKDINGSEPIVHLTSGNGTAFLTPPSKPKTLSEAGEIAREILERHKEYNKL